MEKPQPLPIVWKHGSWRELAPLAASVRHAVFIVEAGIDPALDFDGTDDAAIHVVALIDDRPVATGRLHLPEARIGRMAVLREYRRRGIGAQLLARLLDEAIRAGFHEVSLHAQEHAIPFYERFAFEPEGGRFSEADIPHQRMRRQLVWTDAVAAVIVREETTLLGLRAPGMIMGGYWDLFGGRVETGESDAQALSRELREELSIDAQVGQQLDICIYRDPQGAETFRAPIFLVGEWRGEIALNEEHTACRWFGPRELRGLRLAHPAIPALVEQAIAVLREASGRPGMPRTDPERGASQETIE